MRTFARAGMVAALSMTLVTAMCGPALAAGTPLPPLTASSGPVTDFGPGVTRLAGENRYDTALAASRIYPAGVQAVFVASGADFPDALSASSAAALLGAPLLLTRTGELPAGVLDEVRRLDPERIFVVGGEGSVSGAVATELGGVAAVTRLGGAQRYETGLAIVNGVFGSADEVILATGKSFPDALAASGAAGSVGAPVILVDGTKGDVPSGVLDAIKRLGASKVTIAGGHGSVTEGIESQVRGTGVQVVRQGGDNRYDTAVRLNQAFFANGSVTETFLATGTDFPDALAGSALAGVQGAPLFITRAACMPESVRGAIVNVNAPSRIVIGGHGSVSNAAADGVACLVASTPSITGGTTVGDVLTAHTGAWTDGTSFGYQWLADGSVIGGATGATYQATAGVVGKRISVQVTGQKAGYASESRTSGEVGPIAAAAAPPPAPIPDRVPGSGQHCPADQPIKGNQTGSSGEWIYHVPGGQFYDRTHPEDCFRTEQAARDAGYRKSER